jgi:Holliday junction resolvasome RuvABC endonuclease subunit
MTHLAVDLALGRTGVAWGPGATDHDTIICPPKLAGGERLNWWSRQFSDLVLPVADTTTELVVEGPFLHRLHPTGSMNTIKLHGVIELFAWRHDFTYTTVAPTVLKKWAAGTGAASKEQMMAAAQVAGFEGASADACDAWLLWQYHTANTTEAVA